MFVKLDDNYSLKSNRTGEDDSVYEEYMPRYQEYTVQSNRKKMVRLLMKHKWSLLLNFVLVSIVGLVVGLSVYFTASSPSFITTVESTVTTAATEITPIMTTIMTTGMTSTTIMATTTTTTTTTMTIDEQIANGIQ